MKILAVAIVLASSVFFGCVPPANTNQSTNANSNAAASNAKWDAYVEQFLTDYFAANPTFAVYQGRHEFDGKFPDWSTEGLYKEIARLISERVKASAF
jgi:outer membrane murein-binding lipoprotein Lpp